MTTKSRIDNPDIIPLALYELGGAGRFIDVEDLFMRCYEIAPERFGWRKYEMPNYKIVSKALQSFEEKYPDLLIKTSDGLQRQLSADGVKWIRRRLPVLMKLVSSELRDPPSRRPSQRLLNEISSHQLFISYKKDVSIDPSKYEVADLLLCSPDSPVEIWQERLQTLRSAAEASSRSDLVQFLEMIAILHPEWFKEVSNA